MIKIRIEFVTENERLKLIKLLGYEFLIVDQGPIRNSNRPNNKFKIQYLELVERD